MRDQVELAVAGLSGETRDQVTKVILNVIASAAGGVVGGVSGAGGASVADMYNRQLHPDEGIWIKNNAQRYADKQGISIGQAQAELTGQAQRQGDSAAAERYAENASAREFLAEMTGTQGAGFVYFDGKADGSYDNQILFAGGIKEDADLTELYDLAWKKVQAAAKHTTNLSGSNMALSEATKDLTNYANNPEEILEVFKALQLEKAKAEAANDYILASNISSKLVDMSLILAGGVIDLRNLSRAELDALGALFQSGAEGTLSVSQRRAVEAWTKAAEVSGVRRGTASKLPDGSNGETPLTVRNAEVLADDGKTVLVRQNPITGNYEAVGGTLANNGAKGVEVPTVVNKPLGLGSTGRTTPANLSEKLAMEQAISNPAAGRTLTVPMTDSRWPATDGWVKSAQNINGIEIHYVRNSITGEIDDFKFK